MCGIVGIFETDRVDVPAATSTVDRAVKVMRHRGPDDEFAAGIEGHGAWGMCRLAIRDPAQGRQPFWRDDVGVIFNGEIYNTDDLRTRLRARGHEFATTCDTEVVLACYLEFGVAAFGFLDGIFAVAVVDRRAGRLVLARDEFGVKPLFVRATPGHVSFASEPKALRELGSLRDGYDDVALALYLRYQYVPEPLSPWRNVRRVPCGTVEVFDLETLRSVTVEQFHQPVPPQPDLPEDDWLGRTRFAVEKSVERQLISDRPLGVFLSGGIDSTLVSAVASDLHPGIKAFGISVPGTGNDERPFMEEAARHLDVDLTVTELHESDFDRLCDRVVDVYDEPFGDFSAIPTMLVSEVAAGELRVVLSGDGGDELFAGYARYDFARSAALVDALPRALVRQVARVPARVGRRVVTIAGRSVDELDRGGFGAAGMLVVQSYARVEELIGTPAGALPPLVAADHRPMPWNKAAALDAAMRVDIEQYLPADILTKVDRATMAVSLEARVPLLGAHVARLAGRMPASVKVRDGVRKWPLKALLAERGFADDFLHRKKQGFSFPIGEWLPRAFERRPELVELFRSPPAPLRAEATSAVLDELLAGKGVGHAAWMLLVLAGWLERNA